MNMYVNLCPAYTQKSDSVTMDVPSDMTEYFMQYVCTLSDEKNISARRAMNDMLRYTFDTLMEKDLSLIHI